MHSNIVTLDGSTPIIAETSWVAPTATVVGEVSIGSATGIYYGAVLRADSESISIGCGSNIQDTAVLHADPGQPIRVGDHVSVGHGAVLHGCTVDDGSLIGMNATVLNGAVIGTGSLVAANALVLEGFIVPAGSLVTGIPATIKRPLTEQELTANRANAETYEALTARHAEATRTAPSSGSSRLHQ